jgi:acetyltransferase-like isoleucine patch superfamily enzyme
MTEPCIQGRAQYLADTAHRSHSSEKRFPACDRSIRFLRFALEDLRRRAARRRLRRATGRGLAALGPSSVIVPPATILCPHRIEIGDRVIVMENSHFSVFEEHRARKYSPRLRIGDGTIVGPGSWFSCVGEIDIGEEVLVGAGVLIADAFHEYSDPTAPILMQPMREPAPIRVSRGAFLGSGSALLSGVAVGEGANVMPNSLVVSDVPAHSVAAGNPAEIIRLWEPAEGAWVDHPDSRWAPLLASLARGAPSTR